MGKLRIVGDISKDEYQLVEEVADQLKLKNVNDAVDMMVVDQTTVKDAGGVALNSHASRHSYGGADAIPAGGLDVSQLASETISFYVYAPIPDSPQSGLAADSVGVKFTSAFKLKWSKARLKAVRVRATMTATAADSVQKLAVKDLGTGADIATISANAGTNLETEATDLTNVTDGGLFEVYYQVTTASATAGATFNVAYFVVELRYGAS